MRFPMPIIRVAQDTPRALAFPFARTRPRRCAPIPSRSHRGASVFSCAVAWMLAGPIVASQAGAASRTGLLGAPASSAVLLPVECSDSGTGAPASLVIAVENRTPISGAFVSAQIRKGNFATNTTDPVDDDGSPSPSVFVNGGAGRYEVYVDKSSAGDEAFELTAQCFTGAGGTGLAAGTTIVSSSGGSVPSGGFGAWSLLAVALVVSALHALRRSVPV